jgi:cob(I)alamin adenosyltransferase
MSLTTGTTDRAAAGPSGARVLLFTGDGKGKTTAALGMVLRAVGHGQAARVVQFIKGDGRTGELAAAKTLKGVEIIQAGRGFVPPSDAAAFPNHVSAAEGGMARAEEALADGQIRLLVLDEVCTAVAKGLLSEERVLALLRRASEARGAELTVVLTGRGATAGLIARADTVTEMRCVKHGYASGWKAQAGVEF